MNTAVMFSSATDLWATPQDFFDTLDAEFHFTLDPCCTHENAKCAKHYTAAENGLTQTWGVRRFFVILPMGGNFQSGCANAMMKLNALRWLC